MNQRSHDQARVLVLWGKRTAHETARALAEELERPVKYWPYYPEPESHTVYPPKSKRRFHVPP